MSGFLLAIAGILSGMLGAMGLGGGGVLIIYLTLFANLQQQTAQGINLLLFLPCAAISIILYHRKGLIYWKGVLWAAGLGLFGAVAGSFLSEILNPIILRKIFGSLLALIGLLEIFRPSSVTSCNSSTNTSSIFINQKTKLKKPGQKLDKK